jgi:hypothetical protein
MLSSLLSSRKKLDTLAMIVSIVSDGNAAVGLFNIVVYARVIEPTTDC